VPSYREYFNPSTGEWIKYLETGEETGGERVRYRWRSGPGGKIPEHFHPFQDEVFAIESGEAHFSVNGREVVGRSGARDVCGLRERRHDGVKRRAA
jgi:quercetin dioxygenase-like cupin family protein